jgi:hypothetical protein
MLISDIIREAHTTAVEKGWHERPVLRPNGDIDPRGEVDVDRLGSLLLLIHSEIGEAWDCFQNANLPWEWLDPEAMTRDEWRALPQGQRFGTPTIGFRLGLSLRSNGKPEGLISELADVVIRVCDLAGALGATEPSEWIGDYNDDVELSQLGSWLKATEQEAFNELRSIVDQATENLRLGNVDGMLGELGVLLAECQRMAVYFNLDLSDAVRVKMDFNRTRPHRHGGKAL